MVQYSSREGAGKYWIKHKKTCTFTENRWLKSKADVLDRPSQHADSGYSCNCLFCQAYASLPYIWRRGGGGENVGTMYIINTCTYIYECGVRSWQSCGWDLVKWVVDEIWPSGGYRRLAANANGLQRPGFNDDILRRSGIWGAANEAVFEDIR